VDDIAQGRRLEVAFVLGRIHALGEEYGVLAPARTAAWRALALYAAKRVEASVMAANQSQLVRSISHPGLRVAAERYEYETGRSIAEEMRGRVDESMLGLFLIVCGYSPYDDHSAGSTSTEEN